MRVALYARVSTRDKDLNPENQPVLLRREAERAGDTIIKDYVEEESGSKAGRKQVKELMRDASKRQFDRVRVFALDCFSSQSIGAVFEYTAALDQCGMSFWSYYEPLPNTTGPIAALYKAWAASYHSKRHGKHVRLGQTRRRAQVEAAGEQYQHGRRPLRSTVVL